MGTGKVLKLIQEIWQRGKKELTSVQKAHMSPNVPASRKNQRTRGAQANLAGKGTFLATLHGSFNMRSTVTSGLRQVR